MEIVLPKKTTSLDYINQHISSFISNKTFLYGNLTFSDCTIEMIDIDNLKIKNGSITFKRCKFISYVSLKNIKLNGNINFIECESSALFKLFKIESNMEIFFEYFKTDKKIEFVDVLFNKINILSSTLDYFSINSNTSNHIETITINNCDIVNSIHLFNIHKINTLNFINVKTNEIKLKGIYLNQDSTVNITNSNMNFLFLESLASIDKSNIMIVDNLIDILNINNIKSNYGEISIKNGFQKKLIIGKNISESILIDFSEASLENIDLDESLYTFLSNKKRNNSILKDGNFEQNSKTLQILSKMFADNYQYELQDLCFYYHNNFQMKQKIKKSENLISKTTYAIKYFFGKYFFGWGVKLSNIVNSFFYVIGIYGFLYYLLFNIFGVQYKYKSYELNGSFFDSFYSSALLLFGSYSDFELNNKKLDSIMYSEHLIGILLLAILTGTIIRKLVR